MVSCVSIERFVKIMLSGLGVTRSASDLGEIRGFSLLYRANSFAFVLLKTIILEALGLFRKAFQDAQEIFLRLAQCQDVLHRIR